jgi:hypothetical protein
MYSSSLETIKTKIINEAIKNYGDKITPCYRKKTLLKCFTIETLNNTLKIIFWFNTPDQTTHMITKTFSLLRRL